MNMRWQLLEEGVEESQQDDEETTQEEGVNVLEIIEYFFSHKKYQMTRPYCQSYDMEKRHTDQQQRRFSNDSTQYTIKE
jgi:hypothetical protein